LDVQYGYYGYDWSKPAARYFVAQWYSTHYGGKLLLLLSLLLILWMLMQLLLIRP
jgi:hypothetical protein